MVRIALSTLAARKSGMLGAFAAAALAVVLVVSCGILLDSSLRAPIRVQRLADAGVVVQSHTTFSGGGTVGISLPERVRLPVTTAARVRNVRGVQQAIADRSFDARIGDRTGRVVTGPGGLPVIGHGWASAALTPFTLTRGRAPHSPSEIVLADDFAAHAAISLGRRLPIATATARGRFTVVGIARASNRRLPARETPVFFRDDTAARLSGSGGQADLVGVILERGADASIVAARIRSVLGGQGLRVLTGAQRGEAESPDDALSREDTVAGLTVFALLAAFVALFVVASTFALSVQQRHRELALFRAIGCTPRQVRRMVAGEALLVAIAATVVAAPIAVLAAWLELGPFTRAGMVPEGLHLAIGWLPFVAGLGIAILTTQIAAFASARRAARIRPTDALREASVQRRPLTLLRGLAGLAALAGGIAVVTASGGGSEDSAPAATMVWMIAVALLGPLLALPFVWLIGLPLARLSRGPGLLARANARANLRRVASMATPMVLAVSLVATVFFGKAMLQQQATSQTADRTTANLVLSAPSAAGLSPGLDAAVRRVPGIRQASGMLATSVVVAADGANLRAFPARGVDAASLTGVVDLGIASGSLNDLHGNALAVGTDGATRFGWHLGDRVRLWLGDGTPVTLRVAATFTRPLGFAEIVLPRALVAGHVTHPLDDAVFVTSEPAARRASVITRLEAFAHKYPGLEVSTRAQYERQLASAARHQDSEAYALLGLIAAFCALALVNAIVMSTAERRREFALLRLIGAGRQQIWTMIRAETLITAAFAAAMGTLVALPGLAVLSNDLTGSPFPSVPLWLYGCLIAAYVLLGFAATVLPTRLALRSEPVTAMTAR